MTALQIVLMSALVIVVLIGAYGRVDERARRRGLGMSQLRAINGARFSRKPILNRAEELVLAAAERAADGHPSCLLAFPQVALGEVLRCENEAAFRAINSKRCDVILVDSRLEAVLAIEYQGSGHWRGGTAAERDAIKQRALKAAGIGYLPIRQGTPMGEITQKIREALG